MRDTKCMSEDCFDDGHEVGICRDIECGILDDTKSVGHKRVSDNYLLERSINLEKIPKKVKNKHLKQTEIGQPAYIARSPKKDNNIPPTKRASAKISQVSECYF